LEVAAAGAHNNLLFIGPPGAGKSMLAQRLPGILPPLDSNEILEASMIASLTGLLGEGRLTRRRPFRAPHHNAAMAALIGGGLRARPREGSAEVARRVAAARDIQRARYAAPANGAKAIRTNAEADGEVLERVATPDAAGRELLSKAAAAMQLTARGYHRVLRVARTLLSRAAPRRVKHACSGCHRLITAWR
jgi:predicted ATPase with chaperone activity